LSPYLKRLIFVVMEIIVSDLTYWLMFLSKYYIELLTQIFNTKFNCMFLLYLNLPGMPG
jgi:hypothetical protein